MARAMEAKSMAGPILLIVTCAALLSSLQAHAEPPQAGPRMIPYAHRYALPSGSTPQVTREHDDSYPGISLLKIVKKVETDPTCSIERGKWDIYLIDQGENRIDKDRASVSLMPPPWLLELSDAPFHDDRFYNRVSLPNELPTNIVNYSNYYDRQTYRIEAVNLGCDIVIEPTFTIELIDDEENPIAIWRDGAEDRAPIMYNEYSTTNYVDSLGNSRYRSSEYIRLVSNSRPINVIEPFNRSSQNLYDDEIGGSSTIRVSLGNRVRISAYYTDSLLASTDYYVSSIYSDNPGEILRAHVRFAKLNTVSREVYESYAVRRINEDWAQAGVSFEIVDSLQTGSLRPVIIFGESADHRNAQASNTVQESGTIKVSTITTQDSLIYFELTVARGDRLEDVATRISESLSAHGIENRSGTINAHSNTEIGYTNLHYIYPNQDNIASFRIEEYISLDIAGLEPSEITDTYRNDDTVIYNFTCMSLSDFNESTIDLYIVPDFTLSYISDSGNLESTNGLASSNSDYSRRWKPACINSVFLEYEVVDGDDVTHTMTAGHEIGHILLRRPENYAGRIYHDPHPFNLLSDHTAPPPNGMDAIDPVCAGGMAECPLGPKRLHRLQIERLWDDAEGRLQNLFTRVPRHAAN